MEDSSLDEFLDSGEGDAGVDPGGVPQATPTYCWSPDGAVCDSCGDTARRRWRSEAGLVCRECKEW